MRDSERQQGIQAGASHRQARLLDAFLVLRMRNSSEAVLASSSGRSVAPWRHILWWLRRSSRRQCFIVSDATGVIGYVRFSLHAEGVFIWSFAKEPSRNGVGKSLVSQGMLAIKVQNCKILLAVVRRDNAVSKRLHESVGFMRVDPRIFSVDVSQDEVLLARELD